VLSVQWNVVVSSWSLRQLRFRAVGSKSHGKKKSAYEDLMCDVKTYVFCSTVISGVCVQMGKRIGTSAVRLGAVSEW
jgi:hypothetical protein